MHDGSNKDGMWDAMFFLFFPRFVVSCVVFFSAEQGSIQKIDTSLGGRREYYR